MATFIEKNTKKLKEHALDKMFARQQQINGNAGSASGDIPQALTGIEMEDPNKWYGNLPGQNVNQYWPNQQGAQNILNSKYSYGQFNNPIRLPNANINNYRRTYPGTTKDNPYGLPEVGVTGNRPVNRNWLDETGINPYGFPSNSGAMRVQTNEQFDTATPEQAGYGESYIPNDNKSATSNRPGVAKKGNTLNSNFAQGQINLSNTQGMNPVPDKVDLGIKPFDYGSLNEQPKSNTFYTNAKDNPDLPGFKPSPAGANALNWNKVGTFAGQVAPMVYNMIKGMQKPDKVKPNYNPYESRIRSMMNDRRFNIEPLLNSNRTAQAVANRNIMNAGNSRGELMGNLGAAQNYRMIGDASAWATKNNMDNQYLEEQARMDYMMGRDRSSMDWMTQDANARNKAATNQFMGQGFNDLGKFSQMQQLMANQQQNSAYQNQIFQTTFGGLGEFMPELMKIGKAV